MIEAVPGGDSRSDAGRARRAIILAGGKGTRLAPFTVAFPKPLMPLGETPILEIVLRQLKRGGFERVTLAVGHLAQLIQAYFGDGEALGIEIDYHQEDEPLGTAGALALIEGLDEPFLAMNGDVLSTMDYGAFFDAHIASGAELTIATNVRCNQIDFGVVKADAEGRVTDYIEKPEHEYLVSMGVYGFSPAALSRLTPGERLDFPDLVLRMIADGGDLRSAPFDGYWLDIGRHEDFDRAQDEFAARRAEFLGEEN